MAVGTALEAENKRVANHPSTRSYARLLLFPPSSKRSILEAQLMGDLAYFLMSRLVDVLYPKGDSEAAGRQPGFQWVTVVSPWTPEGGGD